MNVSGSVTVGYGFAAGGSFNKSKINADHASINEQAGIYAGDEGYGIDVNHTDLKGCLITSTQKAKDEGKNRFSTGTITHSDIETIQATMRKDLALEEALLSVVEIRQKKSVVSNCKKSAKITLMEAEKWKPEESLALALKETGD